MATQKALLVETKGAPFKVITRPIPSPIPGDVLVKMAAAALNPIDHKMGVQGFRLDVFPAVLGIDGAGTVEALGEGVDSDKLQKGDSILFERLKFASDYGTFQQYALINAKRTYKIPDTLSFEQAATFPLCLTTAAIGLYAPYAPRGGVALTAPWQEGGLGKYKDQPALVIGGSGSVGQFALQMLKLSGFNPIIATASAHNEAYVRVAGATHLIDYHTTPYDALAGAVAHITSTPLPIVFDAIAHDDTQRAAWELTAPGGALVMVRQPVVGEAGVELEGGRRIAYVWPAVNFMDEEEAGRKWADGMYAGLQEYILDGRVKPNRWQSVSGELGGISEALEKVVKLQVSGAKMVARVDEPV